MSAYKIGNKKAIVWFLISFVIMLLAGGFRTGSQVACFFTPIILLVLFLIFARTPFGTNYLENKGRARAENARKKAAELDL